MPEDVTIGMPPPEEPGTRMPPAGETPWGAEHPGVDDDVIDLAARASTSLELARAAHSGRSSALLVRGERQRVVLMALLEGHSLGEHTSPPAATLHVLLGRVRLHTSDDEWLLGAGDLVTIPPDRHAVDALSDAAFLLTVAL